jgi:hypothetical protein
MSFSSSQREMNRDNRLDSEHEISRLVDTAVSCKDIEVKKKVIDVLEVYGEQGITPIQDIIDLNHATEVKLYALDAIKRIKQESASRRLLSALR